MKIALINIPSPFLIDEKVFPPLGLLYISSALKKLKHEVEFHDLAGKDINKNIDIESNYVFITITTPQIPILYTFIELIRERFGSSKKIIVGGCGAEGIELKDSYIDIIVRGEADYLIPKILRQLEIGIKAVIQSTVSPDLDSIPYPDRNLITRYGYEYKINGEKATSMITSRGCMFNCIFCSHGKDNNMRMASHTTVYKEIDQIYNLGYRAVMIYDDIFTLDKRRMKLIATRIKNKGMVYRCFTHVNFVTSEMVEILVDTNCKEVLIGIESGSDKILKTIKKGFTSEKALQAVNLLKNGGLKVKALLMLGLPGESIETINESKVWLKQAAPTDFDITLFSPYPDSYLYQNKNNFEIDWNCKTPPFYKGKSDNYESFVSTPFLSKEQLVIARDVFEKECRA